MGTVIDDSNSPSPSNGFASFSLDPSHPFYIHPSDNHGSQLVSVPFSGCGFVLWCNSMLTSLFAKNKLSLLDGRVNQPTPESPYCPYWERCNGMVKAWITNSVSREIAVIKLLRKSERMKGLASQTGLTCSCGALPKFIEDQQLFQFLNGLNESYTTVKSAIMLMNPLSSISKAYSLLQQDESQREAHSATPNFSGDATSFLVSPGTSTTNRTFSQKVNFEAKKAAPNVSCKYCKKPSHIVDKCYRLHGFPTDFKFTKSKKYASCVQTESPSTTAVTSTSQHADSSAHGFTKEQYQHLLTMFQQVQMSNTSTPDASTVDLSAFAYFAGLFSKYAVDSEVPHVCAPSQLGVNPWILDTGATNNMTPHKHLLFNIQPLIKPFLVTLPNGYKAKVVSTGSLYLRHDIILLHVLLVPSFHFNLISVHRLICKAADRLYYLHPDVDLFPVLSSSLNVSSSSSLPNSVSTSSGLPSSVSIVFDKSSHVVTHVNVHIDIWGPYNTRTYSGFRYFLTLVDDYSKATWTHLLSCKSNALSVLKAFTVMVKVHLKSFDQTFRSDNAFELGGSSEATTDVVFHEHIFPYKSDHPSVFPSSSISDFVDSAPSSSSPSPTPDVSTSPDSPVPSPPPLSDSPPIIPSPPPLRKSTIQQPSYLKDYFYKQAASNPAWQEAMLKEFQALEANQTWDIVPLPSHKKAIPCKWVYKIKPKADGSIERYKSRLVIRGDTQKEGIDFTETFSLVVKLTTIKCLLTLAAKWGWAVFQLDVNNSFLHRDLHEEVYMMVPPGLDVSAPSSSSPLVCRLKKSLYGLRQASRQCFSELSEALQSRGYISSMNDYSLFTKVSSDCLVVLAVYVDDILLAGNDVIEMNSLKSFLDAQFKIKDPGSVHYFLGLEISLIPQGYVMSQHKYTSDLLSDFNCQHFSPVMTPLDPSVKLV
ncbi:PREDICTED: uncharacterized protein LOC109207644 [Nicotiana attenuata]|uniref:uncharacterized protein LOC109207644 n=1 Tax=Nicotiana attenuata TaxID=49451 RepID=UPI000904EFD4|nr:PREDICTED: uncharacterized protein LOC109207644 [Nicotiana attenuata]